MPTLTPSLWFDKDAEEAANFYAPTVTSTTSAAHRRTSPAATRATS